MELETCVWRGVVCREWPSLPPGALVRSQPELQLKAMSETMAMQWQGLVSMSVAPVTSREHGMSLVRVATGDHMDI